MKITKSYLKKIIKESISELESEEIEFYEIKKPENITKAIESSSERDGYEYLVSTASLGKWFRDSDEKRLMDLESEGRGYQDFLEFVQQHGIQAIKNPTILNPKTGQERQGEGEFYKIGDLKNWLGYD